MHSEKKQDFILMSEGIRAGSITVRLARNEEEITATQKLRYRVFYEEQDAIPSDEMKATQRDFDAYDPVADHLLVIDENLPKGEQQIVGNYRIVRGDVAEAHEGYYTEHQFNMDKLKALVPAKKIMELGRSCVAADYRTKPILQLLWQGLAEYMLYHDIQYFIGCGSFRGRDAQEFKDVFSYLYHFHLAPEEIRPFAQHDGNEVTMNMIPKEQINEKEAFKKLPPLIKGYLRAGAHVGSEASLDYQWGSVDVCLVINVKNLSDRYRKHYERKTNAHFDVIE